MNKTLDDVLILDHTLVVLLTLLRCLVTALSLRSWSRQVSELYETNKLVEIKILKLVLNEI